MLIYVGSLPKSKLQGMKVLCKMSFLSSKVLSQIQNVCKQLKMRFEEIGKKLKHGEKHGQHGEKW